MLLLVTSWWLLDTEVLRSIIGDSIAGLGLGVVAFSVLRGLHLPLRIWPEGPWRRQFKIRVVLGAALALAIVIVLSSAGMTDSLAQRIDVGTIILFATGAVFWCFGLAMVRQRAYLQWYGVAIILGLAPAALSVSLGHGVGGVDGGAGICWLAVDGAGETDGVAADRCEAAFAPALLFLLGVGLAVKLVAEELAFRRLLIGCARRTGLMWVLTAALAATAWYATLTYAGIGNTAAIILGGLGAASAGCLYVLSCSLQVSALYGAALAAGSGALELSRPSEAAAAAAPGPPSVFWVTIGLTAATLCAVVAKRNGMLGRGHVEEEDDVAGS